MPSALRRSRRTGWGSTRTPGFEINDVAFLQRADFIWLNGNVARQWSNPVGIFRNAVVVTGVQRQQNYGGDVNDAELHAFAQGTFLNYWGFSLFSLAKPSLLDDVATRGGAVVRVPRSWFTTGRVEGDNRRRVVFGVNASSAGSADGASAHGFGATVTFKPASNIRLVAGPSWDQQVTPAQFVTAYADTGARAMYGQRAVFAELRQHVVSMDTRAAVTFTPTLSLELYAQPFIATGRYARFQEYVRPRSETRRDFAAGEIAVASTGGHGVPATYTLTPTGTAIAYTFGNPDFNVRSLLGNAVLRWEYRPGSTLFVVWNQTRDDFDQTGRFDFATERRALFHKNPDNTFLVKLNYWLAL